MSKVDSAPEIDKQIVVATAKHARQIDEVYRSVQLDPQILLDLVCESAHRSKTARQQIMGHGGFLSPPDDEDMQRCMRHGLAMVHLRGGEVVGYNRYITDPAIIWQTLFSEFQLDADEIYSGEDSFLDWSGSKKLKANKTLTRIHWVDRQQAQMVMSGARAGLHNRPTGRLVWAIDAAVHPTSHNLGIGKTLSRHMKQKVTPAASFLAYRLFELRKINDVDIGLDNKPSKNAFVDAASKYFAYTDEVIEFSEDLKLTVRWNHWLKHYNS
jgi:hypothetical protein